jgi:uncharacterized protein (TIGR00369 family)
MFVAEDCKDKIESRKDYWPKSLIGTLGIEFISIKKDELIAKMPVDERTKQPFGLLHGGSSVALAETLASIGGWLNADENQPNVVGLEINANHLRATREGFVTGTAVPIHRGRRTQVWEIKLANDDGKLTCISRCTVMAVSSLTR